MVPRGASRNKGPAAAAPSQAEKSGRHGGGTGPGAQRGKQDREAPRPPQARLRESLRHSHAPLAFVRQPASLPGLSKRLCRATLAQEAPLGFTQPTQQSLEARQPPPARASERHPQEGKGRKRPSAAAPDPRASRGRRSPARELPAKLPPPPSSALSKPACQGGPLYLAAGPRGTSGSVVSSS